MSEPATFSLQNAKRIARTVRRVEGIAGNREGADYGTPVKRRAQAGGSPVAFLWIQITAVTALATRRWYLSWKHVRRIAGGWEDHPDGLVSSASDPDTRALNSNEANNDGSGVQGNGVDVATWWGALNSSPWARGAVCMCWVDVVGDDSFYSIDVANAVDGGCA